MISNLRRWRHAIVLASLATLAPLAALAAEPVVRTQAGLVQGVQADGVVRYQGLPYAQPPVGDLRWRPPQPTAPWTGVRPADHPGPICMQVIVVDNGVGSGPASEDCLTLNVFAPAGARSLPVMVWIHGGGFVNGSGGAGLYDGSALARQGVVVVTLNYRLGRFGFFAHPALTAEAHGAAVANYALMDQIAALQWVRRNISAFGGDPDRTTVFGESAGGAAVDRLMLIPQARGLFSAAISESGVGAQQSQTLAEAEVDGEAFASGLGLPSARAAQLRGVSAQAILAAGKLSMGKGEAPILDGQMLKEDPLVAFRAGHEAPVPYLAGSNGLEIPKAWAAGFKDEVAFTPQQTAAIQNAYGSASAFATHELTDAVFAAPARALAAAHAAHGWPAYLYRFTVAAPAELATYGGAIHASERQYVFQTLNASVWPTTANDEVQARTLSAYWVAFASRRDPNAAGLPVWPTYGASDRLMLFSNAGPMAATTPDAKVLDVISQIQAARPPR